jgi:hypothetical protein
MWRSMQSSLPAEPTDRNIKAVDVAEFAKIAEFVEATAQTDFPDTTKPKAWSRVLVTRSGRLGHSETGPPDGVLRQNQGGSLAAPPDYRVVKSLDFRRSSSRQTWIFLSSARIERMRLQIRSQQKDIQSLRRLGNWGRLIERHANPVIFSPNDMAKQAQSIVRHN